MDLTNLSENGRITEISELPITEQKQKTATSSPECSQVDLLSDTEIVDEDVDVDVFTREHFGEFRKYWLVDHVLLSTTFNFWS